MARACQVCGKKGLTGNWVSHSGRRTKRVQQPNLQKRTLEGVQLRLCTTCLKTWKNKGAFPKGRQLKDVDQKTLQSLFL